MTTWTTPCDTSSCIQTRTVGDRVEIRDTEYPEVVLSVPAEAWEAFLASVTGLPGCPAWGPGSGYVHISELDLATLAAERGLPPGGETREEWGVLPTNAARRSHAEPLHRCRSRQTCAEYKPQAHGHTRAVTTWPDGSTLTGSWRPVDTEETKP